MIIYWIQQALSSSWLIKCSYIVRDETNTVIQSTPLGCANIISVYCTLLLCMPLLFFSVSSFLEIKLLLNNRL